MIGEMVYPASLSLIVPYPRLFQVRDLKYFMIMLTVFILGFGVAAHSLIHGTEEFSWHLPRRILNLGYWPIFGELKVLETFDRE